MAAKINAQDMKRIEQATGREYMLRQLAEEAAELCQAALKLIRAEHGETPMAVAEARAKLIEELADVETMNSWLTLCELSMREALLLDDMERLKLARFKARVMKGGDNDEWGPAIE